MTRMNLSLHKDKVWISSAIACILGVVFLVAGLSKLAHFGNFLKVVSLYRLFPQSWIPVLAFFLICAEITVGILLLIPQFRTMAALFSGALLILFVSLAFYVRLNNISVSCGCFSLLRSRKVDTSLIAQDLLLLFLAMTLYRLQRKR